MSNISNKNGFWKESKPKAVTVVKYNPYATKNVSMREIMMLQRNSSGYDNYSKSKCRLVTFY